MKALALLAVIVGSSMAAPAKLDGLGAHQHHHHHPNDPLANLLSAGSNVNGYDYPTPAVPSGLYEVPTPTTTTTTTTTQPPPPPPPVYLPPPTQPPVDYLPPPSKPTPKTPEDSYLPPDGQPSGPGGVIVPHPMKPMPYDINWAVADPESGNQFSHVENSNGREVTGEYSVLLPDNRMQIVRFTSDPVNGYQAEVSYEPAK